MRSLRVSRLFVVAVVAAVAALLTPATPAAAQGQSRPRRVESDEVRLEGDLVQVPVVVSDRSGHYVPGLGRDDFRVFEDGVAQQITSFAPERVPFHVVILLDRSSSTRESIGDIRSAAITLVDQLGPEDRAMIVAFSDDARIEKTGGFTGDKRLLAEAVRNIRSNGRTKLYDAVFAAVRECFAGVEGRKAMVILSDGQDTASSGVSFEEAVDVFRETDVVLYGVRYPDPVGYAPSRVVIYPRQDSTDPNGSPSRPPVAGEGSAAAASSGPLWKSPAGPRVVSRSRDYDPFMERVTGESGGMLFHAESVADMPALCEKIAEELRHVYTLGYQPLDPPANGGHRTITVTVPGRPDAAVRYRLGYTP